jgi:hypothetical protein
MRSGAAFPSGSIPSSISSHLKKSDLMMISLAACMPSVVLAVFFCRKLISGERRANFSHLPQKPAGLFAGGRLRRSSR